MVQKTSCTSQVVYYLLHVTRHTFHVKVFQRVACNLQRVTCSVILCLFILLTGCAQESQAPSGSTTTTTTLPPPPQADLALGQKSFAENGVNLVDAFGFLGPSGIAVDRSVSPNQLYIADTENNRVLRYSDVTALVNGGPADVVIGQADLNSYLCNKGGTVNADTLCLPTAVAVDSTGNLYVADTGNNRVLFYPALITTNKAATVVFGQPAFTTNTNNTGGLSASSLRFPQGVAVDSTGNVYIADTGNNRVLEYNSPFTTNTVADLVFGQPGFISNGDNAGGLSANSLSSPQGLAVDTGGNLYIADTGNNRVLEYDTPLSSDTTADRLFGQALFDSGLNFCTSTSDTALCLPTAMAFDSAGNLYIADAGNNRVLEYDTPLTTDTTADRVFGQVDLFSDNSCNSAFVGGLGSQSLCLPMGVALDGSDNLFVADTGNSRVLKYTPPFNIPPTPNTAVLVLGQSVFTANGINFVDAVGLNTPKGVAVDANTDADLDPTNGTGVLYVADTENNRVLGFTNLSTWTTGTVTAATPTTLTDASNSSTTNFAGFLIEITSGTGAGQVRSITGNTATPLDVTVSPAWTTTPDNTSQYQIRTAASLVIGQPDINSNLCNNPLPPINGLSDSSLCGPQGVAVDSTGNLYVADTGNNRVLEYNNPFGNNPPGTCPTCDTIADLVFGQVNYNNFTSNTCAVASWFLCLPTGVVVDADKVRVAGTSTGPNTTSILNDNNKTFIPNQFVDFRITITSGPDAGQVKIITSNTDHQIRISPDTWPTIPGAGDSYEISGDVLYVADAGNNRVVGFNRPLIIPPAQTKADTVFGQLDTGSNLCNQGGMSDVTLCGPQGVAVDSASNLYVADSNNSRVLEYHTPYTVTVVSGSGDLTADLVFGQPNFFSLGNSPVTANSLFFPSGIALDGTGNLYVVDTRNNRVLKYNTPLTTTADKRYGQPDFTSSSCNNPAAAIGGLSDKSLCFFPGGLEGLGGGAVALDSAGNLYVADTANHRVLRFPP